MSLNLSINVQLPKGTNEKFVIYILSSWDNLDNHKKIEMLSFLENLPTSGIIVSVPEYIFVIREDINILPSLFSDTKIFSIWTLHKNGSIYCVKSSICGLFQYDKVLGMAIAKSFPSGTFMWDVCRFPDEKRNEKGYFIF
jgi:hypothetical protein